MLGAKQFFCASDRERLGSVDEFAPAVVPPARVPLSVLVGHDRARRFEDRLTHEILGCDQLEPTVLPVQLVPNCGRDIWIRGGERSPSRRRFSGCGHMSLLTTQAVRPALQSA